MLKWSLRVTVTAIFITLVGICWWVYSLPKQTAAAQAVETTPTVVVASIEADDVAPSDVDLILAGTGYDEDGGILNEDNNK